MHVHVAHSDSWGYTGQRKMAKRLDIVGRTKTWRDEKKGKKTEIERRVGSSISRRRQLQDVPKSALQTSTTAN